MWVHITQAHILLSKPNNCICSLLPNYQFLFGKLKKIKHCFLGGLVCFCVSVFWGMGASFVITQKKKQERYSPGQSPLKIRLFTQHSPIIHLSVKYVHSLSLFECLFLSDWGYMVIFVLITELLSFFPPSSKACFSVLKNWATCLWGESSALFHSHLFFFFGISEACYAQKCFHSSWTIKSIITAVCFLNMNGNEWQQARPTFSLDLSSGM